jgi:ELWxxDGT repeat protein
MAHLYSGGSRFRPSPWLLLWFLLAAPRAMGQIEQVKDIFPVPVSPVTFNGKLYFAASSAATGTELYRSDLGGNNQQLVKDSNPGPGEGLTYPTPMVPAGGWLYFVASNGTAGRELWKTDGTAAGTVLVKDIRAGAADASPEWLTNVNGTLYFVVATAEGNRDLWKSNGTAAGTVRVKAFVPGPDENGPQYLTNLNGTLYFSAGGSLWKSTGTATGTVVVKSGILPEDLTLFNGKLYFAASDATHGRELWHSDGTSAGTVLLKDLLEGYDENEEGRSSNPYWFRVVGSALYFIADQTLHDTWGPLVTTIFRTDGTAGGIVEVGGAHPTISNYPNSYVSGIAVVGQSIYYATYTRDLDGYSRSQLERIGGPNGGGVLQRFSGGWAPVITGLMEVNGTLFFLVGNEEDGEDTHQTLWRSDGTPGGTFALPPFGAGIQYDNRDVSSVFGIGNWLYFTSSYGSGVPTRWRYDVSRPLIPPVRLNAGGPAYTEIFPDSENEAHEGDTYAADQYFAGGTPTTYPDPGGFDIGDGPLYLTGRRGPFSYNVPVPSGTYQVVLHFAEMYWGSLQAGGRGSRRFHVDVEGVRKLTDYDIFARAGGAARPVEETITTRVTDGTLNVSFVRGAADNPVVAAIEVIPLFSFEGVPLLATLGTKTVESGKTLTFTPVTFYSGTKPLTYSLLNNPNGYPFPTGAVINPTTGTFTWTAAAPGYYSATVKVTDNSSPAFYDGQVVQIYVSPRTDLTVRGSNLCGVTNANGLTFQAVITIKNSQPGVIYQAYRSGTAYGTPRYGNGGDLTLSFPFTSTATAPVTYTFDVVASSSGGAVTLAQKAPVVLAPTLAVPSAAGKTISSGQSATLTASTTQAGITTFRWYNTSSAGTLLHTGSSFTTPALTNSTHFYVAAAYGGCESTRKQVTVTVTGGAVSTFRVNAGGNGFATLDARSFAADAYFSGGVVSAATAAGIAGTADDYLYQTGRHGASFAYNLPTGNGSYDVVLHFAETYFGNTAPGGIGSRKFHVNLEGARKLTDYDVFARAGGALRVAQETFRVTVSDGTLNVAFLKGSADNPAVKAIEVLPAGSALTINAGGAAFTASTGKKYSADVYYASGSVSSIAGGEIANTSDDALYRDARVGVFSYGLPSGNGTFDVTLHFAETYFGSRATGGAGSRKFNVYLEGVKRLSDYDVFAKAGGAMRAVRETIRVTVTDGVLNLYFAKGLADNPLVSVIEVVPTAVAAREAAPETGTEDWQATLFPNPVRDRLTVRLPFAASQVEATAVTDAAGTVRLRNAHRLAGENALEIRTAGLPGGMYLLRLDGPHGAKLVKFLKH